MHGELMNGLPLDVRSEGYVFETLRPQRVGDEAVIVTDAGCRVHVQLLRGKGRKRFLVDVLMLKIALREDGDRKMIALQEERKRRAVTPDDIVIVNEESVPSQFGGTEFPGPLNRITATYGGHWLQCAWCGPATPEARDEAISLLCARFTSKELKCRAQ